MKFEQATFAGGCFWCTEAIFQRLKGVTKVTSGYTGGTTKNPSYDDVCGGSTGHAEAIQIEFDPTVTPYETLLEIFFQTHDPTTLNQQGADIGTQYRSAIFYHSDKQKEAAQKVTDKLTKSGEFKSPIVTELSAFTVFYPAERYHRDYYNRNPDQAYCRIIIDPKITKLYKHFKPLTQS